MNVNINKSTLNTHSLNLSAAFLSAENLIIECKEINVKYLSIKLSRKSFVLNNGILGACFRNVLEIDNFNM